MRSCIAIGRALAMAILASTANAAEEDYRVPATLPDDVAAWICSVEGEAALLAMRRQDGGWKMLGTMREHEVVEREGRFTILAGRAVVHIDRRNIVVVENGETTSGSCSRAEWEIDNLLADLR